jgi:voltage-gated potassium channel
LAELLAVLSQDASGRVRTPLEPLVLAATLAMIPVLILEADATGGWHTAAIVANWVIWIVFAVEFAVILIGAPRRTAALRAHWLDAIVVVVTTPLFGQFLASLRLLRLARLLRLLRVVAIVGRAVRAERALTSGTALRLVALITLFIVFVAGAAQATFDAEEFHSIWDGVWWAVVTVTTVGYGDLTPTTVGGRIIGMLVMFVGIGFLSVLTATFASQFVKTDSSDENSEVMEMLREIREELGEVKTRLEAGH